MPPGNSHVRHRPAESYSETNMAVTRPGGLNRRGADLDGAKSTVVLGPRRSRSYSGGSRTGRLELAPITAESPWTAVRGRDIQSSDTKTAYVPGNWVLFYHIECHSTGSLGVWNCCKSPRLSNSSCGCFSYVRSAVGFPLWVSPRRAFSNTKRQLIT